MNYFDYFDPPQVLPISNILGKKASVYGKLRLGDEKNIKIEKNTLVIIGVNESRNSNNPGASESADSIRKYLYALSGAVIKQPIIDFGNIKKTPSPNDTYIALKEVVSNVMDQGAICIVLGGTQELTWPIYQVISELTNPINVTLIDQTLDMGGDDGDFSSVCYVDHLLKEPFEKLFCINLLAYQGYLTNSSHINTFQNKHNELLRLGIVRSTMVETEPIIRDSSIVSLDMGCIRQCDSPGSINPSPNGLYAEEVCQLSRYAGMSNKIKVFGIFDLNTFNDPLSQSAHLAAQAAWHFIEAFNSCSRNRSETDYQSFKRFFVKSPIPNVELVFLNNPVDESWWMELPGTTKTKGKPMVIACSYNDYILASKGEVPDRWIRISKKMI